MASEIAIPRGPEFGFPQVRQQLAEFRRRNQYRAVRDLKTIEPFFGQREDWDLSQSSA